MTDDEMERIPARKATQILCKQLIDQMREDQINLMQIAFETQELSPKDGWKFDISSATFIRPKQ